MKEILFVIGNELLKIDEAVKINLLYPSEVASEEQFNVLDLILTNAGKNIFYKKILTAEMILNKPKEFLKTNHT